MISNQKESALERELLKIQLILINGTMKLLIYLRIKKMNYLADTHILIWAITDSPKLSKNA